MLIIRSDDVLWDRLYGREDSQSQHENNPQESKDFLLKKIFDHFHILKELLDQYL